jgi:hypothetical protein
MFNEELDRLVARHRARTHAFSADFLRGNQMGDIPERPMFMNTSDDPGVTGYENDTPDSQTPNENYQP